jgi:hypothetical protein
MNHEQKRVANALAILKKIEQAEPGEAWKVIILEIDNLRSELAIYKRTSALLEGLLLENGKTIDEQKLEIARLKKELNK